SFIAGAFIPFRDYVLMYFYITASVFGAGAGAAIIGGLYWRHGTTLGAWSSLITGAILSTIGFILRIIWSDIPILTQLASKCPLNGVQMTLVAALISLSVYVIVSLITSKKPFNLEYMLHRGKYAITGEHVKEQTQVPLWCRLTGIDKEFSRNDKILALLATTWILLWISAALIGSIYYGISGGNISDDAWGLFWLWYMVINFAVGVIVFVWYFIGGTRDVANLFKYLKDLKRDDKDDGTVLDYYSLSDETFHIPDDTMS
ncbi:MAG: hypothetical protein PHX54_09865, partial [Lentimicrobiaceae bacterium]|nr:hypothetical protein [Lentimicrobiaceae bacterium]